MNSQNKIYWTPEETRKTFKCLFICLIIFYIRFTLISILSLFVIPICILPLLVSIALPFAFALLPAVLIFNIFSIQLKLIPKGFYSFLFLLFFFGVFFGAFIWPFLTKSIFNYLMNNILKKIWHIGDKENE